TEITPRTLDGSSGNVSRHTCHGRPSCSYRRHPRRVFGDIADTSLLHGIGWKEAVRALARGVEDGRETRVCAHGAVGRRQPPRALPAVRDTPGHGLQMAQAMESAWARA